MLYFDIILSTDLTLKDLSDDLCDLSDIIPYYEADQYYSNGCDYDYLNSNGSEAEAVEPYDLMSIEEIKKVVDLEEDDLEKTLNSLMKSGIVFGKLSQSSNMMIYRLLPFFPGIFEYSFMKGEEGGKQKKGER